MIEGSIQEGDIEADAPTTERMVERLFGSPKENDRRRYAAIEAAKSGRGGREARHKKRYSKADLPVIGIDSKVKGLLDDFHRAGVITTKRRIPTSDLDLRAQPARSEAGGLPPGIANQEVED